MSVMQAKNGPRTCSQCGEAKLPSEFYKQKWGDGLRVSCKACVRAKVHEYRWCNIEKVRAYDRKRGKRPERILADTDYHRRTYSTERNTAYVRVWNHVRKDKLAKPDKCSQCGRGGRVEAHHEDYSKPLDIIWLCPPCHQALGGTNG